MSTRPDMSRNQELAGKSVKQGGYTVTYDANGYASSAKADGGASANSYNPAAASSAGTSANHQAAYDAAERGDWDAVGAAINRIGMETPDGYGGYDMSEANRYMQALQDQFNYNARDYYNRKYDDVYGSGSAAVFDATNGAVKTADQWAALTGGAAIPSQAWTAAGGQQSGISDPGYGTGGDASQYIRDMYDQQNAAQLAALKSTYDQNVLDYQAQDDLISAEAQRQRNQAAAQNDLQRMYMNEMGIMQGLNTGATGQIALAQSAALQGNLANIGTQEQQSLADNSLALAKLKAQYSAAVDQAVAENNYQLANALYQEYVRQQNLAIQQAAEAQEQANWQAKFDYQKEQNNLADAEAKAKLLAAYGDFSGYKALGYSDAQIAIMQNAYNAKLAGSSFNTGRAGSGTGGGAAQTTVTNSNVTDISKMDTSQFANPHNNTLVQVTGSDGKSQSWFSWSTAMRMVQEGTLKAIRNADGTYTLAR